VDHFEFTDNHLHIVLVNDVKLIVYHAEFKVVCFVVVINLGKVNSNFHVLCKTLVLIID